LAQYAFWENGSDIRSHYHDNIVSECQPDVEHIYSIDVNPRFSHVLG